MATASELAEIRQNVAEPDDSNGWDDQILGDLIDAKGGVNAASASVWRKKAAGFAKLVNVSEAGATHSFSDLQRKALEMAEQFEDEAGVRARVKVIERS